MQDILHVTEVLKGGPSSYLEEILPFQGLAFGSANVRVLIPCSQRGDLPSANDLPTTEFDDSGSRTDHVRKLISAVRQLVKDRRPTVIHAHSTFAGVAVRLALRLVINPPPVVYCPHGWAFDREGAAWKNRVIAGIERLLAPFASKIVCISEHDRQLAIRYGFDPKKLVVVLNGIRDVGTIAPSTVSWPANKKHLLFAGRFDRQKGVDIFLSAMARLGPDYFAYAIGDAAIGDAALPASIPENVKLTGWITRDQVQAYLASTDVFVMPSRWEGFGLSALEAMRAGRTVVASHVGGLPELVEDKVNGLLIEPNSVDSLVNAIASLNADQIKEMGVQSRLRFTQKFQSDQMNAALLRVYQDVCR